nr:hypothetical protein [Tanacetum cinerariifolium]
WSLDKLAYGVPSDGPYQTNPPSPDDIILTIRIDREGQVRRIRHEEEIDVQEYQFLAREIKPTLKPLEETIWENVILSGVLVMQLQQEKNLAEVKRRKTKSGMAKDSKSELDRLVEEEKPSFAFPVLSLVARDILAIPISTLASESTFRTGGRVLDSFRSSLSPETVQALICCQDWVRSVDVAVNLKENIDDLEKFEDEMGTTSNANNGEDE